MIILSFSHLSFLSQRFFSMFEKTVHRGKFKHSLSLFLVYCELLLESLAFMTVSLPFSNQACILADNQILMKVFLHLSHDAPLTCIIPPLLNDLRTHFDALVCLESADPFVVIFHLLEYCCFHLHFKQVNCFRDFCLIIKFESPNLNQSPDQVAIALNICLVEFSRGLLFQDF